MLKVVKTPDTAIRERCSICREWTLYWYTSKDVALCKGCARSSRRDDVPSKKEWLEREDRIKSESVPFKKEWLEREDRFESESVTVGETKSLIDYALKNASKFESKGQEKKAQKWLDRAMELEQHLPKKT